MKINSHKCSMKPISICYLIPGLLAVCLLLASCKNERLSNLNPSVHPTVYMPQAVNSPVAVNLLMADTAQSVVYGANYGGVKDHSKIHVHFEVNTALVDSFNTENDTHYTLMPPKSYSLEKKEAVIPAGKRTTQPLTLSVKTFGHLKPDTKYLLPVSLTSVQGVSKINKKISTTYYIIDAHFKITTVFMPKSSKNAVIINKQLKSNSQTITYSAKYKGSDPGKNLSIDFKVDPKLTKAFNSVHKTHVTVMPKGSYKLLTRIASIPEGKKETQQLKIKLNFTPSMSLKQLKTGYLLPVRITKISGKNLSAVHKLVLDKDKSIVYFLITDRNYISLLLNTKSVNAINMKKVVNKLGIYTYSFETTGHDPNIRTSPLSEDVGNYTVLAFEYKCSATVNDFQIYFAPLAEARSLKTGPLSETSSYTLRKIDLKQSFKNFSWGSMGDFMRFDFRDQAGIEIHIRNIHLMKKQ